LRYVASAWPSAKNVRAAAFEKDRCGRCPATALKASKAKAL
jgi:hypothetical protein